MKRFWLIAFLLSPVLALAQEPVSFFQFSDAHLFDDGYHLAREDAFKVAAEDRRSLRWAVAKMNEQQTTSRPVDFAVFTGDLGLQNVDFSQSRCAAIPVPLETTGLPPFRLDAAVEELTMLLQPLKVPRLYFIAGNNDVQNERISDGGRFSCFMALLQERMKKVGGAEVYPLLVKNSFVVRGVRFAGMDTVSIKTRDNFAKPCSIEPEPINCPKSQIDLIGDLADDSPQPIVIFTHVPDLVDPYRKQPAWDIDENLRKEWEETACGAKVLGIFAGHFHDSVRDDYGRLDSALAVNPCVAAKTRVAPPLAEKNQLDSKVLARGFLRVIVSPSGIQDTTVAWFDKDAIVPPATVKETK